MSVNNILPDLDGQYNQTSPIDSRYNSIAWAMNDNTRCWEPHRFTGNYWPNDLQHNELTLVNLIEVFKLFSYELCDCSNYEPGYEKVAIYVSDGKPVHVARQQQSGRWTSKIGKFEDIEHETPEHIQSQDSCMGIGVLNTILKRINQ